jgi:hypothetical protein
MPENRFHELLGLPEELSDPDYYQLLGVERSQTDTAAIEAKFKEQMTRLQHNENPRHKEFIEFLKGELKRARGILTDASRRKEYDQEVAEERADELRKILSHMLVDGKLSSVAEVSVLNEGRALGLEGAFIRRIVDEELQKAGAKRVSSNGVTHQTQLDLNKKAQEFARQVQDARLQAKVAEMRARLADSVRKQAQQQADMAEAKAREAANRAKIAEVDRRRAEQAMAAVTKKKREAEALARKAITREQLAAAKERMSEQERRALEKSYEETQARFQAYVNAANEELEEIRERGIRWPRLAESYACLFAAALAADALRAISPSAAKSASASAESLFAKVPGLPPQAIPLIGIALLVVPLHVLAGKKASLYVAPLLAMIALALAAGLLRG